MTDAEALETELALAPKLAGLVATMPGFDLRGAIMSWRTARGLDQLRAELVKVGRFDTAAMQIIAHQRKGVRG